MTRFGQKAAANRVLSLRLSYRAVLCGLSVFAVKICEYSRLDGFVVFLAESLNNTVYPPPTGLDFSDNTARGGCYLGGKLASRPALGAKLA